MDDHKRNDYHYYTYGKLPEEREGDRSLQPAQGETMPGTGAGRDERLSSHAPQGGWSYSSAKPPRRSGFKSFVAAFLAGALVVGGLMLASDKMNLFSGGDALGAAASQGVVAAASAGGGTTTAALGDVVRPNTIAQMVGAASPAVVKIETYSNAPRRSGGSLSPFFDDPFYREFFGDRLQTPEPAPSGEPVQVGAGTGFFFDKEGYILTNEHVVNGADEIRVIVDGETKPYTAKLLGTAYDLDLAVLKIEGGGNFPVLPLGSSENIQVGDWVVAIGNPYEFEHTVTVGVLSAKERSINIQDQEGTRRYRALLQTDASINPGNSGGPLLNLNGEVIGINTAVNAQAQGIGFAIPTSTINEVLASLKADKEIPRPFIGVSMSEVPEEFLDDLQLDKAEGAFVREVMLRSPAYAAGLQMYDVIVGVNGEKVSTSQNVVDAVGKLKPGDNAEMNVIRNGKEITVTVTIGDMNDFQQRQ